MINFWKEETCTNQEDEEYEPGSFTVINRLPILHYLLPTVLQKTAQYTRKLNSIADKIQLIIEVNFNRTNTIHAPAVEKIPTFLWVFQLY